ncbi:phosphatase PAP2 family protein [Dyadobacter diqingensis]|uniref:phosphatase PAP2 family protein n=1 Tax=Dyadobacter diqingensis TaxID=2938121 RepID=UPI0020C3C75F|nr:phosphatase PAP2 family protein [Dyadobacter diqingensis]
MKVKNFKEFKRGAEVTSLADEWSGRTTWFFRKIFVLHLTVILALPSFGRTQDTLIKNRPLQFQVNRLYVPGILMASGVLTNAFFKDQIKYKIVEQRNRHFGDFHTSVDNYLEYVSIPIAYGLDVFGVKSKNDFLNRTAILVKGEVLMYATAQVLKVSTHQLRPDGKDHYSFPSGHAAQAFATATFLSEEYKDRLPWMPYAAYTVAGTTGLLRIANNRHYLGDVLFGAGLGLLSMKISYWTHRYRWGKNKRKELSSAVY